jgi:hypothetical protein
MAITRLCKLFCLQFEKIGTVVKIRGLNFIAG